MEQIHHQKFSIGVVGGGQLAKMLAIEGERLGIDVIVQTGSKSDPAVSSACSMVFADTKDIQGTRQLASQTNCVTFENEWVDIDSLLLLEDAGVSFVPELSSLLPLINKLSQRKLLNNLNILGPNWLSLSTFKLNDLNLPANWRFPLMAKSSIGGYDGKGTKVINDYKGLSELLSKVDPKEWFIEEWIDYKKELSLVISRDKKGKVLTFPLMETFQTNQICDWVLAPSDVSHQVMAIANNIGISLVRELNYVGVIAIEFFYGDRGLLVNEIAPRTHNSAHLSIEACKSNQFEHQIAIAAGLSFAEPDLVAPGAIMVNLLGFKEENNDSAEKRLKLLQKISGLSIHWYKKDNNTPGRKLGHVTKLLDSKDKNDRRKEALNLRNHIRTIWPIE